jgi:hypothetical protein
VVRRDWYLRKESLLGQNHDITALTFTRMTQVAKVPVPSNDETPVIYLRLSTLTEQRAHRWTSVAFISVFASLSFCAASVFLPVARRSRA